MADSSRLWQRPIIALRVKCTFLTHSVNDTEEQNLRAVIESPTLRVSYNSLTGSFESRSADCGWDGLTCLEAEIEVLRPGTSVSERSSRVLGGLDRQRT